MPKLTEAAILKREAKRDLAAELRESLAQMKRGKWDAFGESASRWQGHDA